MLVVSRPRASCDAGLLLPRCVSRASHTLADARSSRVHPLRTLRCSEDCPTTVHRPLNGRSRSVLVLRRSRRACLHGACTRARLAAFACAPASGSGPSSASTLSRKDVPRPSPSAFTTKSSWSRSPLSCLPCSPLDDHGQHSIGSQPTGSRIRVTFRRAPATILFLSKIAPASRTRPSRPPSPFGDDVCPAVGPAFHAPSCDVSRPAAAAR